MSQESTTPDLIELTRGLFASASRNDIDAMLGRHAPDAIWDLSDAGLRSFEGVEAIRSFLADWFGSFEDYQVDVEQVIDLASEFLRVVAGGDPAADLDDGDIG